MEPEADLSAQALALMKEWGPVHAGSSAGDFGTIDLTNSPGWVVTSHHDDILTYVAPDEIGQPEPTDLVVGFLSPFGIGKSQRIPMADWTQAANQRLKLL